MSQALYGRPAATGCCYPPLIQFLFRLCITGVVRVVTHFSPVTANASTIATQENSNLALISVTALKRRMSGGSGGGGRRLSIPLADREHALHDKDIDDTLHDTSLLRTQMKLVEKKDFTNEASFNPRRICINVTFSP